MSHVSPYKRCWTGEVRFEVNAACKTSLSRCQWILTFRRCRSSNILLGTNGTTWAWSQVTLQGSISIPPSSSVRCHVFCISRCVVPYSAPVESVRPPPGSRSSHLFLKWQSNNSSYVCLSLQLFDGIECEFPVFFIYMMIDGKPWPISRCY